MTSSLKTDLRAYNLTEAADAPKTKRAASLSSPLTMHYALRGKTL